MQKVKTNTESDRTFKKLGKSLYRYVIKPIICCTDKQLKDARGKLPTDDKTAIDGGELGLSMYIGACVLG